MPVPDRQDPLTVRANLFDTIGTALQMRKRVIRHAMLETLLRGF